jgi:hypothetical protein
MGHLLSSALKMQANPTAEIQYSFTEGSIGFMNISYNGDSTNLSETTVLTTDTLIPASQPIEAEVVPQESGGSASVGYYLNGTFIQSYFGFESVARTDSILTSPNNSYKFLGETAF